MKQKRQYYRPEIPLKERIKFFFGRFRIFHWLFQVSPGIVVSVLVAYLVIYGYLTITKSTQLFKDPVFSGLFGSLLGACIGAFVGGLISLQLHYDSSKSTSAIKDKDLIYKPLYDALSKFKYELIQNRYPFGFVLISKSFHENQNGFPTFVEWNNIKNDNRIIQIPVWLREAFDNYIEQISKYDELQNFAIQDLKRTKQKKFKKYGLTYKAISGAEDGYLHGILNKNDFYKSRGIYAEEDGLNGVDIKLLEQELFEQCQKLKTVNKIKDYYENVIVEHADLLLNILKEVISYVNSRYENQDKSI